MAEIGDGNRFYRGSETQQGYVWTCPRCGQKNVTPLEDGCPGCGAGTAQEREQAEKARESADASELPMLADLNARLLLTVARALAHYADFGAPTGEELPRRVIQAWARKLAAQLEE